MNNFTKKCLFVFFLSFALFSCSSDKFEFDLSKGADADTKREMNMSMVLKIDPPPSAVNANPIIIKTVNSFEAELNSYCGIKSKEKPGAFTFSDKVKNAKFSISQNQNSVGDNSLSMSYKDGQFSVDNKIESNKPEGSSGNDIESKGRKAFEEIIRMSEKGAVISVDKQGNILNVDADMDVQEAVNKATETYSGAFGIVFPKNKKVKVGDIWTGKKSVSTLSSMKIQGDPIEIEITFTRLENEKLDGRKVAVFTSRYAFEKKGVSGIFGGMPVYADIKGETNETLYFDLSKKFLAKTDRRTKDRIVSVPDPNKKDDQALNVSVEIDNFSRSISVVPK